MEDGLKKQTRMYVGILVVHVKRKDSPATVNRSGTGDFHGVNCFQLGRRFGAHICQKNASSQASPWHRKSNLKSTTPSQHMQF